MNSRPWPGGRRLLSVEDSRLDTSGAHNELHELSDRRKIQKDSSTNTSLERQWHATTLASLEGVEASGDMQTDPTVKVPANAII